MIKANFGVPGPHWSLRGPILGFWGPEGYNICDTWSIRNSFRPHGPTQWHQMAKKIIVWPQMALNGPQIASNASTITQEVINWCIDY